MTGIVIDSDPHRDARSDPLGEPPIGAGGDLPAGTAVAAAAVAACAPDEPTGGGASLASTLMRAFSVQLGGRVLGMIFSVLTVAVTTRHLGVDGYGLLTTAVVFIGLWSSLTELGVGSVIVRRVSGGDGDLGHLMGLNLGLSLVYCLPLGVLAALSGFVVYLNRPELHGLLVAVAGSLVLTTIESCFRPVFVVTVRFGAVALADVAARAASLAATLVAVGLDAGLAWFGAIQLAPPAVMLLIQGTAAYRLRPFVARFDLRAGLALLRESLPQTGVLIIAVLYWRADAVILSLVGSTADVGAYGIAYTAAFTLSVLATFYLSSSLSEMTSRFANDRAAFGDFVRSGMQTMAFLGLPLAVLGSVLARPVVTLLGSEKFTDAAAGPLALLLTCVSLTFFTGVLSQALFAAHDHAFLLRLNLVNLVINIALNLALAPLIGAVGAALALVVSEVIGLVVVSWRLGRFGYRTPWLFVARLCVPLAAGALVGLALHRFADGPMVVPVALASGATYLVANLLFGPVRVTTIKGLFGRTG